MSTRVASGGPDAQARLRAVLRAGVAAGAAPRGQAVEYDVLDSCGVRFGSAVLGPDGPVFSTPVEMSGVHVYAPFNVSRTPNSTRLATNLAGALSTALSR